MTDRFRGRHVQLSRFRHHAYLSLSYRADVISWRLFSKYETCYVCNKAVPFYAHASWYRETTKSLETDPNLMRRLHRKIDRIAYSPLTNSQRASPSFQLDAYWTSGNWIGLLCWDNERFTCHLIREFGVSVLGYKFWSNKRSTFVCNL